MILYLHGFNSSPYSAKAQFFRRYLEERGRAAQLRCPALAYRPSVAVAQAEAEIARAPRGNVAIVGSSLGGFYATYLAEKHDLRAVLINPAIDPHLGLRAYLGPQQPDHGGEPYDLTEQHLREWQAMYVANVHPERYLLLVETGDQVLDYRIAVRRYVGAKQVVVQGGDHSFASFPEHLPLILSFAGET
jgi:hypothetical protein